MNVENVIVQLQPGPKRVMRRWLANRHGEMNPDIKCTFCMAPLELVMPQLARAMQQWGPLAGAQAGDALALRQTLRTRRAWPHGTEWN